jgi:hypothetical protein
MKYKIHYAELVLEGDIPCFVFDNIEGVRTFVAEILSQHPDGQSHNMIYLVVIDDDIFVTDNCVLIQELFDGNLNSVYPFFEGQSIYIQEYESYQAAYEVALTMMEGHPLCYDEEQSDNLNITLKVSEDEN